MHVEISTLSRVRYTDVPNIVTCHNNTDGLVRLMDTSVIPVIIGLDYGLEWAQHQAIA